MRKTFLKDFIGRILTSNRWRTNANTNAIGISIAYVCIAMPKGPKQSGNTPITPKELFNSDVNGKRDPKNTPMPAFRITIPTIVLMVPSRISAAPFFCSTKPISAIKPKNTGA
ncbi:hypothetical protein ES708_31213 [subsurface metagenome]